jgi:hypothetical protein
MSRETTRLILDHQVPSLPEERECCFLAALARLNCKWRSVAKPARHQPLIKDFRTTSDCRGPVGYSDCE